MKNYPLVHDDVTQVMAMDMMEDTTQLLTMNMMEDTNQEEKKLVEAMWDLSHNVPFYFEVDSFISENTVIPLSYETNYRLHVRGL